MGRELILRPLLSFRVGPLCVMPLTGVTATHQPFKCEGALSTAPEHGTPAPVTQSPLTTSVTRGWQGALANLSVIKGLYSFISDLLQSHM